MKCPNKQCECIAPSHYRLCPKCGTKMIKEVFFPQIEEIEEVEDITPYVEMSEIKVGEM